MSALGASIASLLPLVVAPYVDNQWLVFSLSTIVLLAFGSWLLIQKVAVPEHVDGKGKGLFIPLSNANFQRLAFIFLLNGLALAIAATLSLFYISDVLQAEQWSGAFLALYFVSGALSLTVWVKISEKIGKTRSWFIGALIGVAGFVWAVSLDSGDLWQYIAICILTGLALGADLALPVAIAADLIPNQQRHLSGGYFGIWSLINKGVLALAAGISLPLLAVFGYQPGGSQGIAYLAILYAGIPCLIKLISAYLIWQWRAYLETSHA